MSADNGIYILKTSGPVFRVAECQGIDDIYWEIPNNLLFNPEQVFRFFEKALVYNSYEKALIKAGEILDGLMVCEYGIQSIDLEPYSWREILKLAGR